MGLIAVLLGTVGNIWLFAILYFTYGIFVAAISPSSAALIATEVDSDFRGRAYAMQQTSRTLGLFIAPVTSGTIGTYLGLNWIFVCFGVVCLLLTVGVGRQIHHWTQTPSSK